MFLAKCILCAVPHISGCLSGLSNPGPGNPGCWRLGLVTRQLPSVYWVAVFGASPPWVWLVWELEMSILLASRRANIVTCGNTRHCGYIRLSLRQQHWRLETGEVNGHWRDFSICEGKGKIGLMFIILAIIGVIIIVQLVYWLLIDGPRSIFEVNLQLSGTLILHHNKSCSSRSSLIIFPEFAICLIVTWQWHYLYPRDKHLYLSLKPIYSQQCFYLRPPDESCSPLWSVW